MAFSMSRTRFSSYRHVLQAAMLAAGLLLAPASQAERIKDLASIQGTDHIGQIGTGLDALQGAAIAAHFNLGAVSHHGLTTTKGRIRLADLRLTADHHGQIAVGNGGLINRYRAVHDHRAGTSIDHHTSTCRWQVHLQVFNM